MQILENRNNEIRDKGLVYLCDALMDNMGLTSLTVWNNGITRESSPALAKLMVKKKKKNKNEWFAFTLSFSP